MSVLGGNPLLLGDDGYLIQRSVRLRSSASAYFNRTFSSSPTTFTFSCWVKRGTLGVQQIIAASRLNGAQSAYLLFNASDQLQFLLTNGTSVTSGYFSTAVFRDPSAWYHVVFSSTAGGTGYVYVNNVQVVSGSVPAGYWLFTNTASWVNAIGRLGDSATSYLDGYLTEINFIDGQALTPSSFGETDPITGVWKPKKYTSTYGTNGFYLPFTDNTLGTLLSNSGNIFASYGGTATNALVADGVYCTSNVSAGSTFTFLQNNFATPTQVTRYSITNLSFTGGASTFSIQSSPDNSTWTTLATLSVTASNQNFSGSLNGYARYFRIAPTSFGTNGSASVDAFLLYADGLGLDFSGNGKNWTPNNISVTAGVTYDSMTDVPTLTSATQANYCTFNPLNKNASSITVLHGNLGISTTASNVGVAGTIGMSTGKWYWETTFTNASGVPSIGAAPATWNKTYVGEGTGGVGYHGNGVIYNNGTNVQSGLASYTSGDVIGVALDMGAGSIRFYKNNVQQGTTVTGITGEWFPAVAGQVSSTLAANFGQRPFTYTPPTGFLALNTFNLPAPTIPNGATQFAATTYTGNGTAGLTISNAVNGTSFQPSFAWFKNRSAAWDHILVDSVRGVNLELYTSLTAAEFNGARVTSLNSNGFTVSSDPRTNGSGNGLVAWQWKGGGTAVTNTSGSITSQVSANPTAGFSIVTYTGNSTANASVGHGLGVTPAMIIIKARTSGSVENWPVYHKSLTAGQFVFLNTTNAFQTADGTFNSSTPVSSTVFQFGSPINTRTNSSSYAYIAYCFAEVAGFSKFGSYAGNGSVDGPFLYCGFRPRFILIKDYGDPAANWIIHDTARNTYNQVVNPLASNTSAAETTYGSSYGIDVLSNGFKIRLVGAPINTTNNGVLFAAFAENPFKNSLAR